MTLEQLLMIPMTLAFIVSALVAAKSLTIDTDFTGDFFPFALVILGVGGGMFILGMTPKIIGPEIDEWRAAIVAMLPPSEIESLPEQVADVLLLAGAIVIWIGIAGIHLLIKQPWKDGEDSDHHPDEKPVDA